MRRLYDYDLQLVKKLGDQIRIALEKEGFTQAQFRRTIEMENDCVVDNSTLGRFLNGQQATNALLIQAIARTSLIEKNFPLPDDYKGGSRTDWMLDVMSGRTQLFDTAKVGKVADVIDGKKSVNDEAIRHSSDRPSESKKPIATIPKKSTKRSGVSVGIREGVKLLREAMGDRSDEDTAVLCSMELARLKKILAGDVVPDAGDLAALMPLFPNGDINGLARAYRP